MDYSVMKIRDCGILVVKALAVFLTAGGMKGRGGLKR